MAGQSVSVEQITDRLRKLDDEALAEVSDFVEFVCQKKEKRGKRLLDFLRERALPSHWSRCVQTWPPSLAPCPT
jgi:hypothetical protein